MDTQTAALGFQTVINADADNTFGSFVYGFYEQYAETPDKTLPCFWINSESGGGSDSEILKEDSVFTVVSVVAWDESSDLLTMYNTAKTNAQHILREYFRHFREDTPDDPIWMIGKAPPNPQPIVDEQKSIGCEFKFTVGYNSDCTTANYTY